MAKAKKPARGKSFYTWKVTRRNNQSVDITAESLGVVDGDWVFLVNGVTSRVISADTYTDVELLQAQRGEAAQSVAAARP